MKSSSIAGLSLPFLSIEPQHSYVLDELINANLEDEAYWSMVRKQFPLKEGQTYFNNGTMGPTSGYALNVMIHHMQYHNIHAAEVDYKNGAGPELLTGYFPYEPIRKKLGSIINADFKEISLTQNATFGMNYIGQGLDLQKNDELINTNREHGGGFGVWQLLAKRKGCVYKQAAIEVPANDPDMIFDAIFSEVTPKTKVIAIPHILSVYGTIMPVKEICAEARKRGIFTVIDGAQSIGQIPVDVKDIGCDAYYSSLHKWLLAPAGSGLLYISEDRISDIWTTVASYNWDNQEDHGFRIMQNGTGNPGLLAGYEAAIDFFNTIGAERWFARIKELGDYLRLSLLEMDHITIHSSTNDSMCAGMTTYFAEGLTGPELQKQMWDSKKLQPRSVGTELLRHCVHIYNSKNEIDMAMSVLKELNK